MVCLMRYNHVAIQKRTGGCEQPFGHACKHGVVHWQSALRSFLPPRQLMLACKSCTEVKDNKERAAKDSHIILVSVDCREITLIPYPNELHFIALYSNAVSVNFLLSSSTIRVPRVGKTCCRQLALTLGSYICGV
jgi:hypothetical protein